MLLLADKNALLREGALALLSSLPSFPEVVEARKALQAGQDIETTGRALSNALAVRDRQAQANVELCRKLQEELKDAQMSVTVNEIRIQGYFKDPLLAQVDRLKKELEIANAELKKATQRAEISTSALARAERQHAFETDRLQQQIAEQNSLIKEQHDRLESLLGSRD